MTDPAARPTRAELRRAREAGLPTEATPSPDDAAAAGVATATGATMSRAEMRAQREARDKRPNPLRVLLTAWWFYPLLLLLLIVVVLGWRSATVNRPSDHPVVIETVPAVNS